MDLRNIVLMKEVSHIEYTLYNSIYKKFKDKTNLC